MKKIIIILGLFFLSFVISFAIDYYPLNPAIKWTYKVHQWDADDNYKIQFAERQIKNTLQKKNRNIPWDNRNKRIF
ncbi:MAG: hypothetical protein ABIB46_05290 [bacterium]